MDAIKSAKLLLDGSISVDEDELKLVFESSYGIFNGPSRQVARLKFTPFRARWVACTPSIIVVCVPTGFGSGFFSFDVRLKLRVWVVVNVAIENVDDTHRCIALEPGWNNGVDH